MAKLPDLFGVGDGFGIPDEVYMRLGTRTGIEAYANFLLAEIRGHKESSAKLSRLKVRQQHKAMAYVLLALSSRHPQPIPAKVLWAVFEAFDLREGEPPREVAAHFGLPIPAKYDRLDRGYLSAARHDADRLAARKKVETPAALSRRVSRATGTKVSEKAIRDWRQRLDYQDRVKLLHRIALGQLPAWDLSSAGLHPQRPD